MVEWWNAFFLKEEKRFSGKEGVLIFFKKKRFGGKSGLLISKKFKKKIWYPDLMVE